MNVILILIFVSLGIALFFLGGFIWSVKSGQFDDTCTPSMRMLADEEPVRRSPTRRDGSHPIPDVPNRSSALPAFSNSTKTTKKT